MTKTASAPGIQRLAKYELLAELATGGMASVYVARQVGAPGTAPGMERLVAIKRIHRHLLKLPQFREMFQDEARVAALIRHPNVVRLLDIADDDGELFLVLEYVESAPLSMLLREVCRAGARLPPAVVSRILLDVLSGLQAAHETTDTRGRALEVVHRDVSPQNILVGVDGVSQLIDFGIARAAMRATETTGGVVKGKLAYMSPEQAKGTAIDRRSDVFSAGIVLWESLTSRRLFAAEGSDGSNVLLNVLLETIEPPSSIAPEIATAVDSVVARALERVREERFQTASELHDALAAAIPPASPRQVASVLDLYCGASLRRRRDELREILEALGELGVRVPSSPELPRLSLEPPERPAVATGMATAFEDRATARRSWIPISALLAALAISVAAYWKSSSGIGATERAHSGATSPPVTDVPSANGAGATPSTSTEEPEKGTPPSPPATGSASAAAPSSSPNIPRSTRSAPTKRAKPPPTSSATPASIPPSSAKPPDLHPENPY